MMIVRSLIKNLVIFILEVFMNYKDLKYGLNTGRVTFENDKMVVEIRIQNLKILAIEGRGLRNGTLGM